MIALNMAGDVLSTITKHMHFATLNQAFSPCFNILPIRFLDQLCIRMIPIKFILGGFDAMAF
jgi:hypothetical protein